MVLPPSLATRFVSCIRLFYVALFSFEGMVSASGIGCCPFSGTPLARHSSVTADQCSPSS